MAYGVGIPLQSGYDLGAQIPLDSRTIVENKLELNNLDKTILYKGLVVYCKDEDKYYKYTGSSFDSIDIPISATEVPLMDGVANAGSKIGIYSNIDHVHPTDSTRASVEYVQQLNQQGLQYIDSEISKLNNSIINQLQSITQSIDGITNGTSDIKLKNVLKIGSKTYDGSSPVTITEDELLSWNSIKKIFSDNGITLDTGKIITSYMHSDNLVTYQKTSL